MREVEMHGLFFNASGSTIQGYQQAQKDKELAEIELKHRNSTFYFIFEIVF